MNRSKAEKISKALADATRLSILEAIFAKKKVTCTDLVNLQGITPATVSHHLKVLADAGLIECQRQGRDRGEKDPTHSRVLRLAVIGCSVAGPCCGGCGLQGFSRCSLRLPAGGEITACEVV